MNTGNDRELKYQVEILAQQSELLHHGQMNFEPLFVVQWRVTRIFLFFLMAAVLSGCTTSTIESRRTEKTAAYNQLTPEEKTLVDEGQIKIGMSADAVYIAWGKPAEILQEETPEFGRVSVWRYYGTWMEETRYWAYRETKRPDTDLYLERYLISDYNPRDYVRAEIIFKEGKVNSWRTLPRPVS